jgi:hypothetical protein
MPFTYHQKTRVQYTEHLFKHRSYKNNTERYSGFAPVFQSKTVLHIFDKGVFLDSSYNLF